MRRLAVDALIAAVFVVVGFFGTHGAGEVQQVRVTGWMVALAMVAAAALAFRRVRPRVTLAVVAAAASVFLLIGGPFGPILIMFGIAVYTVARHQPVRPAATAAGVALGALLLHTIVDPSGLAFGAAWAVVPFALGVTVRLTREAAERARAELARQHADDERLRVAQEVHDIVGHGLSAINMQAEIALHLLDKRPEQAEAALTAISRTSRAALDELRVTLALVRRDRDDVGRSATAGLARLDDLVARVRESGVPVRVEITGERRELPAAIDLAAYRVVQESLTNVLRHAGVAEATVRLGYEPREVTVEIRDTGRGTAASHASGGGHGLAGMRERVDALGGEFAAGPVVGSGFRVYAKLPLP
ncbi:sensor histidine kinase [Actinomycetes bacterium KLBMP 9797]